MTHFRASDVPINELQVIENFERTVVESAALDKPQDSVEFKERLLQERRRMNGTLTFAKMKLDGIDTEVTDAMSRIEFLRSKIQNQLSVILAVIQQDRDDKKHKATIHYSNNQQVFAALGVFFLPGTFFAAIFSTTFFDFHASNGSPVVSSHFWIFWALTIPTMILLALLFMTARLRQVVFEKWARRNLTKTVDRGV